MKFKYITAPLYKNLLPAKVLEMDVSEGKADCESCTMSKSPVPTAKRYREDLKCCTFYPFIPNYAVGAILTEEKFKKGAEIMREIIRSQTYSLPIGLVPPVKYQLEFKKRKDGDFGNIEDWLCPYFDRDKEQCTIWSYRGSVCTSFYCKSSYGLRGKKFWNDVSNYLSYVEMALLEEALIRLDFSPRQISDMLGFLNREEGTAAEKKEWNLPLKTAKLHWRDRLGEQEQFFIKCYEIVKGFDRKDFREMLGQTGEELEVQLLRQHRKIHERN
jgi:Fe-S-cluster containining protein